MTEYWTNPSVLALAGDRDPVDVIVELAREAALDAMESGWSGPPFDPFELARIRDVPLVPREELADARTVADGRGGLVVEYNPNRPRGRLRFSIAHELAHSFFPDAADAPRYRRGPSERHDDWQLEVLCNVAAAEMLMPVGTFAALAAATPDVENLMKLRAQHDVSTEALFRRVVSLSDAPLTFFAASRIRGDDLDAPLRIDYTVTSKTGGPPLARHMTLPPDTSLRHCTAVGYTDSAVETWAESLPELDVQGVGIPPFPGQMLPRVAGFVRARDGGASSVPQRIKYVVGDATQPRGDKGPRFIAHVVNDKTANWGGQFARTLARRFEGLQETFQEWVRDDPGRLSLGRVHVAEVDQSLYVATLVAQRDYGRRGRLSYSALRRALDSLGEIASVRKASVHMPRIGAGQAGGSWDVISELIELSLVRREVEVTVYTLPGAEFESPAQTSLALGY